MSHFWDTHHTGAIAVLASIRSGGSGRGAERTSSGGGGGPERGLKVPRDGPVGWTRKIGPHSWACRSCWSRLQVTRIQWDRVCLRRFAACQGQSGRFVTHQSVSGAPGLPEATSVQHVSKRATKVDTGQSSVRKAIVAQSDTCRQFDDAALLSRADREAIAVFHGSHHIWVANDSAQLHTESKEVGRTAHNVPFRCVWEGWKTVLLVDLFASRDWLRVYLFLASLRSTLVYSFLYHWRA